MDLAEKIDEMIPGNNDQLLVKIAGLIAACFAKRIVEQSITTFIANRKS